MSKSKNKLAETLRAKSADELAQEVAELQRAHFNLRMQKGVQNLADHSQLGKARRAIARAKTIHSQKLQAPHAAA